MQPATLRPLNIAIGTIAQITAARKWRRSMRFKGLPDMRHQIGLYCCASNFTGLEFRCQSCAGRYNYATSLVSVRHKTIGRIRFASSSSSLKCRINGVFGRDFICFTVPAS